MVRVLVVLCFIGVGAPAWTATVPPWSQAQAPPKAVELTPFQDALDAFFFSYRNIPGTLPLPPMRVALHIAGLSFAVWWIANALPRSRTVRRRYAPALAALASSRMR